MSDTQLHDSVTPAPSTATPGELLSRQRESLGVPLADAARALNLRPAVVDGLERDHYEEIPVAAYRRGYLRAYAKYLGMDDRMVLDAYQARHGTSDADRKVAPVAVTKPPLQGRCLAFQIGHPVGDCGVDCRDGRLVAEPRRQRAAEHWYLFHDGR